MLRFKSAFAAILSCGIALFCASFSTPVRAQVLALNGSGWTFEDFGVDSSAGWSFTTSAAVTVDALDALDPAGTGNVRLYDASGLLASATVTNADPQVGSPVPFFYQTITPITLAADQTYYIVEDVVAATTGLYQSLGPVITIPSISFQGAISGLGLGTDPTSNYAVGPNVPQFFGPNFNVLTPPPTPEPGSVATLVGCLTAISASLLRSQKRCTFIR